MAELVWVACAAWHLTLESLTLQLWYTQSPEGADPVHTPRALLQGPQTDKQEFNIPAKNQIFPKPCSSLSQQGFEVAPERARWNNVADKLPLSRIFQNL